MLKLSRDDQSYLDTLYRQFKNPKKLKLKIGKNFFPSALLNSWQRKKLLGVMDYRTLQKHRKEYEDAARNAVLILNPMNGGIGTSIERRNYLRNLWKELGFKGTVTLGAKGCDLYFEARINGKKRKISISEAKILRARREKPKYKKIVIQYLVSTETIKSVRSLLNRFSSLKSNQLFSNNKKLILVPPLMQSAFPTINEKGEWNWRRRAPGGHGQWLYLLLKNALKQDLGAKQPMVSALYNEDGLNNTVDPLMVGWMVKEQIPAVMVSTTKTSLDTKGGLLGLARIQGGWHASSACLAGGRAANRRGWKKEILELAQARASGQEKLFFSMGIQTGKRAGQYFNTNTILLNYTVLLPLLKKMMEQKGMKRLIEMTAPGLIQNSKNLKEGNKVKKYIQLEGALGSALLNLDHYLLMNSNQRECLKILNLDEKIRYRFFTPIKNAFDFWIQFYSDLFEVDTRNWTLNYVGKGMLPKVILSSYYDDLEHVLNAFGTDGDSLGAASLKHLKELEIQGKVRLAGAQLHGRVALLNESPALIDLNHSNFRKYFQKDAKGRLILKNLCIRIRPDRKLTVSSLFEKR